MNEILQYLKSHGAQFETAIAQATDIPLVKVRKHLSELASKGEIIVCHMIRYLNGERIEGLSFRISGCYPCAKPVRVKSKPRMD